MQIVVGPALCAAVTHMRTRASPPTPRVSYMYFVFASTSGGGVGSRRPRSEYEGVYCFIVGLTGLFGSSARSRALIFGGAFLAAFGLGAGRGDGGAATAIGRWGATRLCPAAPGRGPGEAPPEGAGFGALPTVCACAVLVGAGFGLPLTGAGVVRAIAAGTAEGLGATGAGFAGAGDGLGTAGAAVGTGFALGRAVGRAGSGVARTSGAVEGAGEGTAVGGTLTDTATGPTVGTVTGAAGICAAGCVSTTFCVGAGCGCGVVCGIGSGFGGAVGAVFANS